MFNNDFTVEWRLNRIGRFNFVWLNHWTCQIFRIFHFPPHTITVNALSTRTQGCQWAAASCCHKLIHKIRNSHFHFPLENRIKFLYIRVSLSRDHHNSRSRSWYFSSNLLSVGVSSQPPPSTTTLAAQRLCIHIKMKKHKKILIEKFRSETRRKSTFVGWS